MVKEFIEGWDLMQILGEGTFAEVKLLVNRSTGEATAVKEVNYKHTGNAVESDVRKEICVHKLLKHRNIVQCYGSRIEDYRQFIFLEYCSGGELFDRIEPDRGMPEFQAQGYFNQLISGVDYLHRRGVAHRDIKPENLLLTENDVLKISDFGMATVFRHHGKERLLERRCGTRPYMAPEMLLKTSYNAEPIDIWSCGIVLVAMLAGVLPWDQPTPDQKEVVSWKEQEYEKEPWSRIDNLPLSLLRKILNHFPSRRYTMSQISNHIWVKKKFKGSDGKLLVPTVISPPLKKIRCSREPNEIDSEPSSKDRGSVSQPPSRILNKEPSSGVSASKFMAFSQPASVNDMYTATQTNGTQNSGSQTPFQRLVKRMTRFWISRRKTDDATLYLKSILEQLGYSCKYPSKGIIHCETSATRGTFLSFKITMIEFDGIILVDLRLSRGCGIDFKRHFAKIRTNMSPIIEKNPIIFPSLLSIKSMPGVPE